MPTIAAMLEKHPRALANSLSSIMRHHRGYSQFIVVGPATSPKVTAFLQTIRGAFSPNRIIIHIDPEHLPRGLAEKNEVVRAIIDDIETRGGGTAEENVRLCEGFTCRLPVTSVADVQKLVDEVSA